MEREFLSEQRAMRLINELRDYFEHMHIEYGPMDPSWCLMEECMDVVYGLFASDPSIELELPDAMEALADDLLAWKE